MSITRPSLSMLPVEDLSAELKSNKPGRKFMTKEDKATDVESVAGIAAENIAVAVSPTERTTVENAQKLNGRPAEEYLDKEEGDKILGVTDRMSAIYSNEIQGLREEVYQLKSELNRNGFVEDRIEAEGFTDTFKQFNKKYEGYICRISKEIIGTTEELYLDDLTNARYFEVGKKFVIKRTDLDREIVVTSQGLEGSGKVRFTPAVDILDSASTTELWKTTGEYIRDSFSFSEVKEDVANSLKERYFMQADDTNTKKVAIKKSGAGFAAYFKIPHSASGALTRFGINATVVGNPDSLLCHVINKKNMYDFKNIDEAKTKGYVISTSQPVQTSDAMYEESDKNSLGKEVFFNFFDVNTNRYPILKSDADSYVFIVECMSATEHDYWNIVFSYYKHGNEEHDDLQRNNKSFLFENIVETGLNEDKTAITEFSDINKYDLLFSLVTREVQSQDEMGKQSGVYTAKILLPHPINVSRGRIESRINREGCYYVDSHNQEANIFTLASETTTSHTPNDTRFAQGDKVIIGNQIAEVKRMSANRLETVAPVHIDPRLLKFYTTRKFNPDEEKYEDSVRIPVYRMNYTVKIKPSFIDWSEWDSNYGQFKTTDLTPTPIEMKLKQVMAIGKKVTNDISEMRKSDRIIFEADFGKEESGIAKIANEFEVEIAWRSPFSVEEINSQKDSKDNEFKELIGRLHELVLTFDRNY